MAEITIMEALQTTTEKMKEYTDEAISAAKFNESKLTLDTTLSIAGQAADSKAVGDAISNIPVIELATEFTESGKAADAKAVGDAISNIPMLELTTELTESGKAADAKAVGDIISMLPISISDDGFSEVLNQRKILNIQSTKTDNKVNVVVSLEGNKKVVLDLTYNENNYPISLTINGRQCTFGWSGF